MNPAKIQILGNYWDCQIYRGRLYLFTIEGTVKTINWNKLIESLQDDNFTEIALSYAFKNGRNLYHEELHELFKDKEIKNILKDKFKAISQKDFIISEQQLSNFLIGEQTTPFKELNVDSEIFSNKMYVLSHNSLLSSAAHSRTKYPLSTKIQKHADIYGYSIRANRYARLAVSAGDDGLMEYDGSSTTEFLVNDDRRLIQLSNVHSSFADYSFLSVYNSSLLGNSCLSYFEWDDNTTRSKPTLIKKNEFSESNIFKEAQAISSSLSWGSNEKIYRTVDNGLQVVRFNNYAKGSDPIFSEVKNISFQPWKGRILSAYVAYFGTVLQCENAVVVMLSDGRFHNIQTEATRVRIFPRSLNYENHLHIIHDDKLEVYSFNHDYFVDQKTKDIGMAFRSPKAFGFARGGYSSKYESDEDFYDFNINPNNNSNNVDDSSNEPSDLPF